MEAIWNYNTIVDRKRWGIGNTIASSPYAHGEHPERWRANGTFPFPMKAHVNETNKKQIAKRNQTWQREYFKLFCMTWFHQAPESSVLNLNNTLTMHLKARLHTGWFNGGECKAFSLRIPFD